MTNSIILENVSADLLKSLVRDAIREEFQSINTVSNETKKYWTRKEAASLLKISLVTLNYYTKTGVLKGSRIGSRVLYADEDIQQAIKDMPTVKHKRK